MGVFEGGIIGNIGNLAIIFALAVICFLFAYLLRKRKFRGFERRYEWKPPRKREVSNVLNDIKREINRDDK